MKTTSTFSAETGTRVHADSKVFELALWTILLAAINFSLLAGRPPELFVLDLQRVKTGELWRIVTYPFAHVSIYHLFMDASAFLLLYAGLEEKKILGRLSYTAGCGLGSLLFSLLFSHTIGTVGLSGLSGIAHGLMAVTSMELMKKHERGSVLFRTGLVVFSVVLVKSIVEAWTGEVVFSGLHIGSVGIPVVEAHLGGVMGGVATFLILERKNLLLQVTGSTLQVPGLITTTSRHRSST